MLKKKLLIVDDDADFLEALELFLSDEFDVTAVQSGELALSAFLKNKFDLVLTDLDMPGKNGIEVCKEIKSLSTGNYTPVVLLTGMSDEKFELAGFNAGADGFLSKPFSRPVLMAKCRAMTHFKSLHDQLASVNSLLEEKVKEQVLELQKINQLRRYFSPSMVENIIDNDEADAFGDIPVRKTVTVLFCDIRNFSKISDKVDPQEVKTMLDAYLSLVTKSVFNNNGTVNKFMGDGALALFGSNTENQNHCVDAIGAALQLKSGIKNVGSCLSEEVRDYLKIGIGIHTGSVVLGNVGTGQQVDYTVVGASVNLAARLQAFSLENNIIITTQSLENIEHGAQCINTRREKIKGFHEPVEICEIIDK